MSNQPQHQDLRLVPISDEHITLIRTGDLDQILTGIGYILNAYDAAPPMTHISALAYMRDVHWWRNETSDLDAA